MMAWFKRLFGGKQEDARVEWSIDGQPRFIDEPPSRDYDYREPNRKSRIIRDDEVDPSDEILEESQKAEEKQPEEKKEEPRDLRKQLRITGYDVLYFIPDDMKQIKVQIQASNGRLKNEYTLTNYLSIKPGERVRLIIK